ncbi:hypothetical protein TUZN_1708 [Thermoproteus uzoniensis 768-20]|uniref:Piwi domain-containing protein n=1 Tax=Thermoproteus uzoniensis (strain 768-20) TaxID=999630 RepID=F2L352_THEU7|nr:hypothetical protein [Thermoproteus uzoniensis]AEA13171.1 hypothetical protein TUZN_1708 [Thermoproteus uzoniensis 768-20]
MVRFPGKSPPPVKGTYNNKNRRRDTRKILVPHELLEKAIDGLDCLEYPHECAKKVVAELRRSGGKAYYLKENPKIILTTTSGNTSYNLQALDVKSLDEVLGFEFKPRFIFGNKVETDIPYGILENPPYECPDEVPRLVILYEDEGVAGSISELLYNVKPFNELFGRPVMTRLNYVKKKGSLEDALKPGNVTLLVASEKYLKSHLDEITQLKLKSFKLVRGRSLLQIINSTKFANLTDEQKQFFSANLVAALYFKAGCVPYGVVVPKCELCNVLQTSLYVGVALARGPNGYYKGVAFLMEGLGSVVNYVDTDEILKGSSMEFGIDEAEKFGNKIGEMVMEYKEKFGEGPENLYVVRSRAFASVEATEIKKRVEREIERKLNLIERFVWKKLKKDKIVFMSPYKTKYNIGDNRAIHVKSLSNYSNLWLVQPPSFRHAVRISYHNGNLDKRLPILAYLYLRWLDFTSLTMKRRSTIAPVTYAKRYLKWLTLQDKIKKWK